MLFFFNDTATTEIYTLSLHDALPILRRHLEGYRGILQVDGYTAYHRLARPEGANEGVELAACWSHLDRKSTRLNSSHAHISYAVFCLKKTTTSSIQHVAPSKHLHRSD